MIRTKNLSMIYKKGNGLGTAKALTNNPKIIFSDEFTLGLDPIKGSN